jgi:hypothetical protein
LAHLALVAQRVALMVATAQTLSSTQSTTPLLQRAELAVSAVSNLVAQVGRLRLASQLSALILAEKEVMAVVPLSALEQVAQVEARLVRLVMAKLAGIVRGII